MGVEDMIRIRHPDNFPVERAYIFDVIFREFLGLEYTAVFADTAVFSLARLTAKHFFSSARHFSVSKTSSKLLRTAFFFRNMRSGK